MTTLKEFLGERFEQFVEVGSRAVFCDHSASDMNREELLALVGWLGERHLEQRKMVGDIIGMKPRAADQVSAVSREQDQ